MKFLSATDIENLMQIKLSSLGKKKQEPVAFIECRVKSVQTEVYSGSIQVGRAVYNDLTNKKISATLLVRNAKGFYVLESANFR